MDSSDIKRFISERYEDIIRILKSTIYPKWELVLEINAEEVNDLVHEVVATIISEFQSKPEEERKEFIEKISHKPFFYNYVKKRVSNIIRKKNQITQINNSKKAKIDKIKRLAKLTGADDISDTEIVQYVEKTNGINTIEKIELNEDFMYGTSYDYPISNNEYLCIEIKISVEQLKGLIMSNKIKNHNVSRSSLNFLKDKENFEKICCYVAEGYTTRDIAKEIGKSHTFIQSVLKDLREIARMINDGICDDPPQTRCA